MSERKPHGVPFESFVERQIREAQERGAFDDLPGFGKPIPNSGRQETEMDWAAKLAKREGLDTFDMLPPALALAREVEKLPAALAGESTEQAVRDIVLDLNKRILQAHRRPQDGPQVRVRPVDVEQAVADWRVARSA